MYKDPVHVIFDFIYWYFILFPVRLYVVLKRILYLFNNNLGVSLNFRLIFTPLFGDYTIIGRLVGFVIRLFEIIFGLIILFGVFLLLLIIPIIWIASPIILIFELKLFSLLYFILIFVLQVYVHKDRPRKKVLEIHDAGSNIEILESFRPASIKLARIIKDENHITKEFTQNEYITELLTRLEISQNELEKHIFTEKIINVNLSVDAYNLSKDSGRKYVEPEYIFLSAIKSISNYDIVLSKMDLNIQTLESAVNWLVDNRYYLQSVLFWQEDYVLPPMGGIGRGLTGRVTKVLDSVSTDFTKLVSKGEIKKIVGRKEEIEQIAELLSDKNTNVLIIGPSGSGKTTLVKGIAHEIVSGVEFKSLKYKRIVSLNIAGLLSGVDKAGGVAQKVLDAFNDAKESGDIILFLDEIHNIGSHFSILQSYLENNNIQFIGATDQKNYSETLEPNSDFTRLFSKVQISEASKEETLEILKASTYELEKSYSIKISYLALLETINLGEKLVHDRVFPDKAVMLLTRSCAENSDNNKLITKEIIQKQVSEVTHVPVGTINNDESEKLLSLFDQLKKRVIGQDMALKQATSALQRARTGIRDESRPIASFLFVGTTGVGKTETAKAITQAYFEDEKLMIRLDMSEYQTSDSLQKLIGSSDGKIKGHLTEKVKNQPFALILLDELEKADTSVITTFLQVLDDARLTDGSGTQIHFSNTIIIATSNVGSKLIQDAADNNESDERVIQVANEAVRDHFAPEFLNRFDGIITFRPLKIDHIRQITRLMLKRVTKTMEEKGIKVTYKDELIEELIKRGYSRQWGARPMQREIENSIETYLSVKMLKKELNMGDTVSLGLEVYNET